jgi:hypothetical protein
MSTLMIVGSTVGAILGIVHAWGVYVQRIRDAKLRGVAPGVGGRLEAAYRALWTATLWTVFGTYVLVLWLISLPFWVAHRVAAYRSPDMARI